MSDTLLELRKGLQGLRHLATAVRVHPGQKAMLENSALCVSIAGAKPLPIVSSSMTMGDMKVICSIVVPPDEIWIENEDGERLKTISNLPTPPNF